MATRDSDLTDVYTYNGSLLGLGSNIIISSFSGPTTASLEFDDTDDDKAFDTGEPGTINGEAIVASGSGTVSSGISLGGLLTVNLGTPVSVNIIETATTSYVQYPDGDEASLLDGLVSQILATPGIGTILSILGITDIVEYVEQNALLTFNITTDVEIPVCFGEGTLILTREGPVPVEELKVGDSVITRDNGFQEITWIGCNEVAAQGTYAPIVFEPGSIGNDTQLRLSPEHRVLITGWAPELLTGQQEVLTAAKHLTNGDTIRRVEGGRIKYFHILLARHEIVFANGAQCESLHTGQVALRAMDRAARAEILALFPELAHGKKVKSRMTARRVVDRREGRLLGCMLDEALRNEGKLISPVRMHTYDPDEPTISMDRRPMRLNQPDECEVDSRCDESQIA